MNKLHYQSVMYLSDMLLMLGIDVPVHFWEIELFTEKYGGKI